MNAPAARRIRPCVTRSARTRVPYLFGCLAAATLCATGRELNLPDLLVDSTGEKVNSPAAWQTVRRPELLELFRTHIYGRAPVGRPETLSFTVTDTAIAMDGKANRKLVDISFSAAGGTGIIHLVLFTPRQTVPTPCFLLICNRGEENIDPARNRKSPFWPAEMIVERGYAAAAFLTTDVAPDNKQSFEHGVHKVFGTTPGARKPDSWGTIAAWAWGASRVLDYLETDREIDSKRVAVVGHSRGGKTALWAGAEDERFAMVVSNDSGSTGAALARGKAGERIRDINRGFPYWFCDNYKKFDDREDALPVDQHMLLALSAPRLLYVASAAEDTWADPRSEFLSAVHATPAYRLLGHDGLGTDVFPEVESPVHNGRIGYHVRSGKHNLTEYDWGRFMDFAAKHGWKHRK